MRTRHAAQQQQDGGQRGEQDSLQYAQQQHPDEGDRRGVEVEPAGAPHTQQCRDVEQSGHRRQHHSSQHCFRQVFQQSCEENETERERNRREDESERGACARLVVDR